MIINPTPFAAPVLAVFLVPPVVWWSLERGPAIGISDVRIETQEVPRGGNLKVKYFTTFLKRCSGKGTRYFVDAAGSSFPVEPYEFRDGIGRNGQPVPLDNPRWVPVEAIVPDGATPGPAQYQNVTTFYCNPLQKALGWGITFAYPLIRFSVETAHAAKPEPPVTIFKPVGNDYNLQDRAASVPASSPSYQARP